jgi:RHS repeat-associated protein
VPICGASDRWGLSRGFLIRGANRHVSRPGGRGLSAFATTVNQISATGLTYDASGNMLTDGLNTYGWNAESEIKSAAGVNYTYDGDGNRLQKSNGKIYWYGAGTEILDESDASGNFTNEYVFFGGKRIAMRNVSSGTIYYYAEDMLGSSRTLVQAGQTSVCYDADFYPFGGERDIVTTCSQNYKFEGKERDTETNNDDFGARYYSSRFGRWLSADWSAVPAPVPYANLTNPQTLNLYAMVSDNPETFADLDGHDQASPTSTVTQRECDDKKCTTINNAGQCEGSGCPSQTAQQQQSQTAAPEKKKPKNDQKKKGCDQACHARRHADYLKLAADSAMLLAQFFPEGEEEAFNLEAAAAEAEVEAEAAEAQAEELAEAAADADHAGEGVRNTPKDRTGQGNVDQLEGVEHERATKTKQGGYRISPKKSQQNVDHTNRGGRPGQDITDEYEGVI